MQFGCPVLLLFVGSLLLIEVWMDGVWRFVFFSFWYDFGLEMYLVVSFLLILLWIMDFFYGSLVFWWFILYSLHPKWKKMNLFYAVIFLYQSFFDLHVMLLWLIIESGFGLLLRLVIIVMLKQTNNVRRETFLFDVGIGWFRRCGSVCLMWEWVIEINDVKIVDPFVFKGPYC